MEKILERVGDKPLYITFDLDYLDSEVAPGLANLEPAIEGGMMPDVLKLLQGMRSRNIIGGEVVCLMPKGCAKPNYYACCQCHPL